MPRHRTSGCPSRSEWAGRSVSSWLNATGCQQARSAWTSAKAPGAVIVRPSATATSHRHAAFSRIEAQRLRAAAEDPLDHGLKELQRAVAIGRVDRVLVVVPHECVRPGRAWMVPPAVPGELPVRLVVIGWG